jgi:hypothetical protein
LTGRVTGEAGTGLFGSFTGLVVFLLMMSFAAQVLTTLSATTAVTSAAFEAARVVARGGQTTAGEQRGRALLGRSGDRVAFDWSHSSDDTVVLRVRVSGPRLAPGLTPPALGEIDRTVRVHVERWR